jgi:hypothetical protein
MRGPRSGPESHIPNLRSQIPNPRLGGVCLLPTAFRPRSGPESHIPNLRSQIPNPRLRGVCLLPTAFRLVPSARFLLLAIALNRLSKTLFNLLQPDLSKRQVLTSRREVIWCFPRTAYRPLAHPPTCPSARLPTAHLPIRPLPICPPADLPTAYLPTCPLPTCPSAHLPTLPLPLPRACARQ